jgi:hypothetical protein
MPFVTQTKRRELDTNGVAAATEVGDLCYVAYRWMMDRWKAEPRWRTAHVIYRAVRGTEAQFTVFPTNLPQDFWQRFKAGDLQSAIDLAWQVFFQLHVMHYEHQKREENGDIQ